MLYSEFLSHPFLALDDKLFLSHSNYATFMTLLTANLMFLCVLISITPLCLFFPENFINVKIICDFFFFLGDLLILGLALYHSFE